MDKSRKVTVEHEGRSLMLIGMFKNGLPTGTITVMEGNDNYTVESPLDGSEQLHGAEEASTATPSEPEAQ